MLRGLPLFLILLCGAPFAGLLAQNPENLLLKDFEPVNIHNVPRTKIEKAAFPIVDMHSHPYADSEAEVAEWVQLMDRLNVDKTCILTYTVGEKFDSLAQVYGKYPDHFILYCGIDFNGYDEPGWSEKAVAELERCHRMGARGVGEIHDKGEGLRSGTMRTEGLRIDDPKMKPLLEKMAELNMPLNIHVAEPMWMYEPMDATNDGLMNAYKWRIDLEKPGLHDHGELIAGLERAVAANPRTTFVASHIFNCSHDLNIPERLFDNYPNLYADNSARYGETAAIPRRVKQFYEKYADRMVYGTDMGPNVDMYHLTFRLMETLDEHFYYGHSYHWPMYGFGVSEDALEKIYGGNARKIMGLE